MGKAVNTKVIVTVRAYFDDEDSDVEKVRYLMEQDLEDAGWDADVECMSDISLSEDDRKLIIRLLQNRLNADYDPDVAGLLKELSTVSETDIKIIIRLLQNRLNANYDPDVAELLDRLTAKTK